MGSSGLPLFPEQASTFDRNVASLYFFIVAVSSFFALAVAVAVIYFGLRYRRAHEGEVGARIEGNLVSGGRGTGITAEAARHVLITDNTVTDLEVAVSVAALGLDRDPIVIDGLAVDRAKPEPDLLEATAHRLGIPSADCWCVGDARWDMLAAVAAGMWPVGVTTGAASVEDLREAGAMAIVERLDQLLGQLAGA